MHPQSNSVGADSRASRPCLDSQKGYEADQRGLLDLLLEEFPGLLSYREALTARVSDPEDFDESDAFANAARGLVASGLVLREGELIIPSRAARQMIALGFGLG